MEKTLCRTIHTINFQVKRVKEQNQPLIRIDVKNTLDQNRRIVPIFPMRGRFCFLYNLGTKEYDIQEFEKLDILPAYPKTILLPNGDLHLIGGID